MPRPARTKSEQLIRLLPFDGLQEDGMNARLSQPSVLMLFAAMASGTLLSVSLIGAALRQLETWAVGPVVILFEQSCPRERAGASQFRF